MICLRKLPHLKIYSIFAFLFFSFFLSAGISQDSYATSVTCDLSGSNLAGYFSFPCDLSSVSQKKYISVDWSFTATSNTRYAPTYSFTFGVLQSNPNPNAPVNYVRVSGYLQYGSIGITSSDSGSLISSISYWFGDSYRVELSNIANDSHSYTLIVTISDNLSELLPDSDCPVCEVCPVIPDNPYDNKFDAITKAIYTCGAVLIMLYFFFCIYKIIVKDGGSR